MKLNKSNKYFSNLLLFVTFEVVIIIAIIASALYYAFRDAQLTEIYGSSKDNLSQVSYSTSFMVDSAKALLAQMYFDDNISKLRFGNELEPQDMLRTIRLLTNYSYCMPFVDSIYIYNRKLDTFYTTLPNTAVVKGSMFFDKDIMIIPQKACNYFQEQYL